MANKEYEVKGKSLYNCQLATAVTFARTKNVTLEEICHQYFITPLQIGAPATHARGPYPTPARRVQILRMPRAPAESIVAVPHTSMTPAALRPQTSVRDRHSVRQDINHIIVNQDWKVQHSDNYYCYKD